MLSKSFLPQLIEAMQRLHSLPKTGDATVLRELQELLTRGQLLCEAEENRLRQASVQVSMLRRLLYNEQQTLMRTNRGDTQ